MRPPPRSLTSCHVQYCTCLDGELLGQLLHQLDGRVDDVLPGDVAEEAQHGEGQDDVLVGGLEGWMDGCGWLSVGGVGGG